MFNNELSPQAADQTEKKEMLFRLSVENTFEVLTKKLFDVFIEENCEYEDCGDLVGQID